ncbi:hypothetical protein F8271_10005 [Micromonospora sp. ALFpr18c]|uniref:permease prefix domain 1-containing protein n=1 Tax=Micromonospora sp. ALFpr18c TaxID=1458665 RepID=UPI00124AF535|nr:permease prefix domain 1-containing protein [Micromonospora sp. ALFpr18c]KAB1943418.1 hypothetical protein F8271_10005 [Micromonospora sp. ALFpr18c]
MDVGVDVSDRKRPEAPGDVDRHLDEMFNRLAGTGAAGRRALAEVEDHLRDAVADELTQGVPARQAERNAVARFGPPARIAGQLRRTHRVASGAVMLSGAWLLIGLAALMLAAIRLAKTLDVAIQLRLHPERLPRCVEQGTDPVPDGIAACGVDVLTGNGSARTGVIMLLLAVVLLASRWLAIRLAGLAPVPRRFPLLVAALVAASGIFLFLLHPITPYGQHLVGARGGVPFGWTGLWHQIIVSGLTLLTALITVGGYLVRTRQTRAREE